MTPEEQEPTITEEIAATATGDTEAASQPMNRAERRAQAKGKKPSDAKNSFAMPQPTNLRGMTSRAGKGKTMFSRKAGSK